EERGLAENTIVIFTSDHGDWLGDHGMMLKGPMFYEGLLRVAMIIKGPGIPSGVVSQVPVANTDLAASVIEWAGISSKYETHGKSLKSLVENRSSRDFAYGEWDLNPIHWGLDLKLRVVRTPRYKLTLEKNTDAGELYDLQEDPHEITNLFDQSKTIRKELEDMIRSRPEDELSKPLIPSGLH
ncbi:MAG: sulfatase/phosphatase domain-containing protein, partial [SAR324 cluster bacterium]|nr:sulfatase/phosphatase domain-containing protein [SAR324 cluster bacterium]